MGGNVDAVIVGIGDVLSYINEGTVKPLLVVGFDKLPAFPDVTTVADLGFDETSFENVTYVRWLLCGPEGVDPEITAYVASLFRGAMEPKSSRSMPTMVLMMWTPPMVKQWLNLQTNTTKWLRLGAITSSKQEARI